MATPRDARVRHPAVAGLFYPADGQQCQMLAKRYVSPWPAVEGSRVYGALVPHAGWICSGAIAGEGIAAVAASGPVDVVVVFGAVHTSLPPTVGALDGHQWWKMPGGDAEVCHVLVERLLAQGQLFIVDERAHDREHAVEVQVPLVQAAFDRAAILPVQVPAVESAAEIGRQTARAVAKAGLSAVFLGSSDLTHYGPTYGFSPAGLGLAALEWAKENDRRLLDLVVRMKAGQVVQEVQSHLNACGAGAIAATMAACQVMGASAGVVLRHANSYETLAKVAPQRAESAVGYAAVAMV